MRLEELQDIVEKLYGNIDLPVVLTDDKLELQWANGEALRHFPTLAFKNGILEVLNGYEGEEILKILKQGKVFTAEDMLEPLNISRLSVYPVIDGVLSGCIFIFNSKQRNYDFFSGDKQENIISSFADGYKMPLTIIFSTLGLMVRNIDQGDTAMRSFIKLISQNCYRIYRLSNNLSDIARFNSGKAGLCLRNGDLTGFVKGLCEAAGILTSAIDIALEYEVPGRQLITSFDPQRLSTAILNLVSNSCKFTREGNVIKVRLEAIGDNAVITVTDSGAGIKDEIIKHIFEPYFSYDPGGRPYFGSGLGLTIVKSIVTLHGGTIAVRSKEGEGTRVAFTLPIRPDEFAQDYTAESGMDYLGDRFSALYLELSDICGAPMP